MKMSREDFESLTEEQFEEIVNDLLGKEIDEIMALRDVFFSKYAIFKVEGEEHPIAVHKGFEEFVDGVELVGDDLNDIGVLPKPD